MLAIKSNLTKTNLQTVKKRHKIGTGNKINIHEVPNSVKAYLSIGNSNELIPIFSNDEIKLISNSDKFQDPEEIFLTTDKSLDGEFIKININVFADDDKTNIHISRGVSTLNLNDEAINVLKDTKTANQENKTVNSSILTKNDEILTKLNEIKSIHANILNSQISYADIYSNSFTISNTGVLARINISGRKNIHLYSQELKIPQKIRIDKSTQHYHRFYLEGITCGIHISSRAKLRMGLQVKLTGNKTLTIDNAMVFITTYTGAVGGIDYEIVVPELDINIPNNGDYTTLEILGSSVDWLKIVDVSGKFKFLKNFIVKY